RVGNLHRSGDREPVPVERELEVRRCIDLRLRNVDKSQTRALEREPAALDAAAPVEVASRGCGSGPDAGRAAEVDAGIAQPRIERGIAQLEIVLIQIELASRHGEYAVDERR